MSLLNLVKFKLDVEIQNTSQKKGRLENEIVHIQTEKYTEAEELSNWHKDFQINLKD